MRETYGTVLPGMNLSGLAGKLIVIEGTDGAGRTTQINLLKPWLEELGHAVLDTGMTRSPLAGEGIRRAKEGNNLGRVTQSLFYATDFVDRLQNQIIPALRAGFVVLTDRYIYSLMARAIVRGVDPAWIRALYGAALKPDVVFYLRLRVEELIPRVVFSRGFDYWESGMDLYPAHDMFEGFCNYQRALLSQFDQLSAEYSFETVDASPDARTVFSLLKNRVLSVLEKSPRQSWRGDEVLQGAHIATPPAYVPARAVRHFTAELPSELMDTLQPVAASLPHANGNGNGNGHHPHSRL
jgi:dTMP kinase